MSKLDEYIRKPSEDISKKVDEVIKPRKIRPVPDDEEPDEDDDTKFMYEDKQKTIDRTLLQYKGKNIKLRHREEKMIKDMEYDSTKTMQGTVLGLAVIGLVFIMLMRNMLPSEAAFIVVVLIGSMMFLPVGMIIGWVALDPVMRCKILRKTSKRNYGIVNFVGKGRRIVSKIKNFDYGLIWQKNSCWALTKGRIYQLTKDGNAANEGKHIDPDSVVTLVDTVPVIFVDMDSFEPLKILQGSEPVYPDEIGPALKAWDDNQKQKRNATKKAADILMYVAIACAAGAIVVGFLTMQKVEELTEIVKNMQEQVPPSVVPLLHFKYF
jgi:hypothetical protein